MKEFRNITLLLSAIMLLCLFTGCQESEKPLQIDNEDTPLVPTDRVQVQIKPAGKVGETTSVSKAKPPRGKAIIEVINPVIDFGKLSPKDKFTGEFRFKNTGTDALQIKRIKSTCGCTIVDQAKMKKIYEPGESGSFSIIYTAGSMPGPVVRSIIIYSNSVGTPAFICQLKAIIEIAVSTTPKKFNLSFREENGGIGPINLKSTDGTAFKIINFSSTRNAIHADFDPNIEAHEFLLQPTVDMTKFTGKILGGIINITLSHPKAKSVKISYSVKPLWTTTPAKFLVMDAKRDTFPQRDLFIKSNYGEKVEIESVNSQVGLIEVVSQEQDGNSIRMKVGIRIPSLKEKPQRFIKDTLMIKLKTGDILNLDCVIYLSKEQSKSRK